MGQLEKFYPPPTDKKINWDSFDITHKIGSGGFGDVFLGNLKENKTRGIVDQYAIKRIVKQRVHERKLTSSIQLEKKILHESKC